MKTLSLFILLCITFLANHDVLGQNQEFTSQEGVLHIIDWPYSAYDEATYDSLITSSEILPIIDSLILGYDFNANANQPFFSYTIEWKTKGSVFIDGEERAIEQLPGPVYIESLVIQSEVVIGGTPVAKFTFMHDSLMAEPTPGMVTVEHTNLTWDTLFEDTGAANAQSYFLQGFELVNPLILEITFVYFEDEVTIVDDKGAARQPTRRTIYRPGISIWVNSPRYYPRPRRRITNDNPPTQTPRGDQVGKGETVDEDNRRNTDRRNPPRTEEDDEKSDDTAKDILSGRKKKKDDDEEEDKGDLMPAAVIGAAAVVAAAFIGGTIGYYGNTEYAPIGLMTGYVQPEGGVLLQLAVNKAVIERSKVDTEYFIGRITSFYDLFKSPIQPALGLGVLVNQQNNQVDYELSVSPGLAGNFGHVILLGGYDVVSGGLDIGLAYNFRAR